MQKPKLTLVGAGPGDPELITLKGVKALQQADAVLYDALANPALLKYVRAHVPTIFVGKRRDFHGHTQDEIHALILQLALEYGNVVRLKGGDPFVFGRGYEEMEVARQHQIDVEYIPGISSSIAAAGVTGIPVTHRGSSDSFWVVTGTTSSGEISEELQIAVQTKATVVILMGLGQLAKITTAYREAGKNDAAVAVIQNGSQPDQKIALGTIRTIEVAVAEKQIHAPAVIVVGETVRLHPCFSTDKNFESHVKNLTTQLYGECDV